MTTDESPAQQRERFLRTYFKHMPQGHWGYIFSLSQAVGKGKRHGISLWHQSVDGMLADIALQMNACDIYFGTSLSDHKRSDSERVKNDDASAILGLRIDIDIASPDVPDAHKAEWLPRDYDEAMRIIDALPEPTIIVHSGNGIHAHWLFDEAFKLDTPERRASAMTLMDDWIAIIRARADEVGREVATSIGREPQAFHIDGTQDLSRVLRVAGTLNHKSRPPKLATLITCDDDVRYSIDELTQVTIDYEIAFGRVTPIDTARRSRASREDLTEAFHQNFRVSADAQPPFDKWSTAMRVRKFSTTWNRKRTIRDDTPSGWDEALAVQCLLQQFSEQETIDTLVAYRRAHNENLKLDNAQYYVRSVANAKTFVADYEATHTTPEPDNDESQHEAQTVGGVTLRDTSRAYVRKKLGVLIDKIIKYLAEEPVYRIILDDGREVVLSSPSQLITYKTLKDKLAGAANIVIPPFDKDEWHVITKHMMRMLDEEQMPEATRAGRIAAVLDVYLRDHKPQEFSEAVATESQPFALDGHVHVFSADIKRHINLFDPSNPVDEREMCVLLRIYGAEQVKHYFYIEADRGRKRRTSCSVWRLPVARNDDEEEVSASA